MSEVAPISSPYDNWKLDPSPVNLRKTVDYLEPTINHVLQSINAGGDPFIKSKARVLTAKAVQSYKPEFGAALHTWTSRQLLPLRRIRRQSQSAVTIPESVQLDAYHLMKAEQTFRDEFDRDPDALELADAAKMSIKRIEKIRKMSRPVPAEGAFNTEAGAGLPGQSSDYAGEALDYIYHDADYTDRKIIELKLGYAGNETLPANVIAAKLGLSPSQLSRRSARIAMKIQEIQSALEQT